jgi:hypothetical protein
MRDGSMATPFTSMAAQSSEPDIQPSDNQPATGGFLVL